MGNEPLVILFDAAGTLIETAEPVERVYARVMARHGMAAPEGAIREGFFGAFGKLAAPDFGNPAGGDAAERDWWWRLVREVASGCGHGEAAALPECFEELYGHYAAGAAWRVFPEVRGILEHLRERGHRLAVASNFDRRLHRVLRELELDGFFERILTSADVSERKPSPALLRHAVEILGGTPGRACLVGDSVREDLGAANAAGMPCFLVERPGRGLEALEEWISANFQIK